METDIANEHANAVANTALAWKRDMSTYNGNEHSSNWHECD